MEIPTSDIHKMSVESFDTAKLLVNGARQRDQRKLDDVLIIDIDCHHYENESLRDIIQYIENPAIKQTGLAYTGVGGTGAQTQLLAGVVGYQDVSGRITRYPLRKLDKTPADGTHRDIHLSLKLMDAMGSITFRCFLRRC